MLVFGLVADHVTTVEVDFGGEPIRARLENNAYALAADATVDAPLNIRLHRSNGTSVYF